MAKARGVIGRQMVNREIGSLVIEALRCIAKNPSIEKNTKLSLIGKRYFFSIVSLEQIFLPDAYPFLTVKYIKDTIFNIR